MSIGMSVMYDHVMMLLAIDFRLGHVWMHTIALSTALNTLYERERLIN
jgi:hypothetical protein